MSKSKSIDIKSYKLKKFLSQTVVHIIVLVLLALVAIPIYFLLIKSVKTPDQELFKPFSLTFPLMFENYSFAWNYVKDFILNTVFIAVFQAGGIVLISSFASYAFIRYKFPLKNQIFIGILSLMMIPGTLTLIPQYKMVINTFNLGNTYLGIILPSIAGGLPMGIFLLNTFFSGMPKDLFDAAEIDGANKFIQYLNIAIPLSIPIIATLGMMNFLGAWNDLLWPRLILQEESMHTITVGLSPFTDSYYNEYLTLGVPFAGYVIVSIPLVLIFFLTSKQFIRGLTSGAFKM